MGVKKDPDILGSNKLAKRAVKIRKNSPVTLLFEFSAIKFPESHAIVVPRSGAEFVYNIPMQPSARDDMESCIQVPSLYARYLCSRARSA